MKTFTILMLMVSLSLNLASASTCFIKNGGYFALSKSRMVKIVDVVSENNQQAFNDMMLAGKIGIAQSDITVQVLSTEGPYIKTWRKVEGFPGAVFWTTIEDVACY